MITASDFEGCASYIPKETFLSAMSLVLKGVDLNSTEARCDAYIRAGYSDRDIIELSLIHI